MQAAANGPDAVTFSSRRRCVNAVSGPFGRSRTASSDLVFTLILASGTVREVVMRLDAGADVTADARGRPCSTRWRPSRRSRDRENARGSRGAADARTPTARPRSTGRRSRRYARSRHAEAGGRTAAAPARASGSSSGNGLRRGGTGRDVARTHVRRLLFAGGCGACAQNTDRRDARAPAGLPIDAAAVARSGGASVMPDRRHRDCSSGSTARRRYPAAACTALARSTTPRIATDVMVPTSRLNNSATGAAHAERPARRGR